MSLIKYLKCACAYGAARSAVVLKDAQLSVYNHQTKGCETRRMLITEKVLGFSYGTLVFATMAPFCVVKDVCDLDLYLNDRYAVEIKKRPQCTVVGYIFNSLT